MLACGQLCVVFEPRGVAVLEKIPKTPIGTIRITAPSVFARFTVQPPTTKSAQRLS
jgi:hypothetical protein